MEPFPRSPRTTPRGEGETTGRLNLAGRAGTWSADNWKKALFGWLVLALAAMAAGNLAGHVQMPDSKAAAGETGKALSLLERSGFKQPAVESVLVQSPRWKADSSPMISALGDVVASLDTQKDVTNIQNPLVEKGGGGQISGDGHSVLVQFTIKGDPDKAQNEVKPILDAIAGVQTAHPDVSVREVGAASATYERSRWSSCSPRSVRSSRRACRCCSPSPPCSPRWASSR